MKKILVIILLFSNFTLMSAQTKPEFELTIYGEDAKGNKDSVIVAYDRMAQYETRLETAFGDISIATKKLDSVFEMRVHKSYYIYRILDQVIVKGDISKHITLQYGFINFQPKPDQNCIPYGITQQGFIMCKVKYPPLKLSWDKNRLLNNSCASRTFIIDNEYVIQHDIPERTNYPFIKLANVGFLTDSLTKDLGNRGEKIPYKFPDGIVDTVNTNYVICFRNAQYLTPTEDFQGIDVKTFPNPCKEILNVQLPEFVENVRVNIHSIDGALMQAKHNIHLNILTLDIQSLSIGSHTVEVISRSGRRFVGKFMKL